MRRLFIPLFSVVILSGFLIYLNSSNSERELRESHARLLFQSLDLVEDYIIRDSTYLNPRGFLSLKGKLESHLPFTFGIVTQDFESIPEGLKKEMILRENKGFLVVKDENSHEILVAVKEIAISSNIKAQLIGVYRIGKRGEPLMYLSFALLASVVILLYLYFNKAFVKHYESLIRVIRARLAKENRLSGKKIEKIDEAKTALEVLLLTLDQKIHDLSNELKYVKALLSHISDIFIVLDREGKVKRFNEAAREIFGDDLREGIYFFESVREPDVSEFLREHMKRIGKGEYLLKAKITLKRRVFEVSGSYIEDEEERVYIFHDITKEAELERTKREFIANLSHEMRTPLSAIKGFVETLEDERDGEERLYLETIKRNTERLIRIVDDLLYLSKIEEGREPLDLEEIDLQEVIFLVMKLFEPQAKKKGLKQIVEVEEGLRITADRHQLEKILINLVDNAMKYTERGFVKVMAKKEGDEILIEVEDTGYGIPERDQPRIFERFYVVDKSRSKKYGGFGLGLSIVKHLVELRGGKISVKSSPGMGSKFIIRFPASFEPKSY